jgi:hypothetical protein
MWHHALLKWTKYPEVKLAKYLKRNHKPQILGGGFSF